jgi:predicted DNA-binding protein with PD1-like motif
MSISDKEGTVLGGHVKSGSLVGITAEIVIGELESTLFSRKLDSDTGFEELVVEQS